MNQLQEHQEQQQHQPQPQIQTRLIAAQQTISGPLPAPEILRAYEDMTPGAAQIILDMALKDQEVDHELRRAMQATIDRDNLAERAAEKRGQWLAFFLLCAAIFSACLLALMGREIVGAVLAGAPVASVIAKIITRK